MFAPTAEQVKALEYVMEVMKLQMESEPTDTWDRGFNTGVRDCISVLDNVIRGDFNYDQHIERLKDIDQ